MICRFCCCCCCCCCRACAEWCGMVLVWNYSNSSTVLSPLTQQQQQQQQTQNEVVVDLARRIRARATMAPTTATVNQSCGRGKSWFLENANCEGVTVGPTGRQIIGEKGALTSQRTALMGEMTEGSRTAQASFGGDLTGASNWHIQRQQRGPWCSGYCNCKTRNRQHTCM